MSPFVKDVYYNYFQMLQTFYVKPVTLYYESMPSFRFFSTFTIYLFYFISDLSQVKIHLNQSLSLNAARAPPLSP
jgi:hypothetical protein